MTKPLVGATTLGFGACSIDEVFDGLVAVGAQCCELNARPGQHGGETLTATRIRPLIERTGVQVTSLGGYNDFAADDLDAEVERLLQACRLASDLEVGVVRAMAADVREGVTLAGVRDRVIDGFGRAAEQAGRLGVRLALENHGRLANDGRFLAEVVDAVGSDVLGFTLDTGNFAWADRSPAQVTDDIAAVEPRALSVHVKDVRFDGERFDGFVPAGQGQINLAGIVAGLAGRGYTGPIISEYEGPGSHADGTKASIVHLRTLVDGHDWGGIA